MPSNKQLADYISLILNKLDENDIYTVDVGAGVMINIRRERDGERFINGTDHLVVYQSNDNVVFPSTTQWFSEEDDFGVISAIRYFIKLIPGMATPSSMKFEGHLDLKNLTEKHTPSTTSSLSNYHGLSALEIMNIIKEQMHGREVTLNQELTQEEIKVVGNYVRTNRLGDWAI